MMIQFMCDELCDGGTITQDTISARYGQTPKGEPLLSTREIRRYCYEFGYSWRDLKQEAITGYLSESP